ncbi:MAG: DUF5615 family PIN-like protein [Alphaproteobacteria bacterium]|nr:DUF5615 family PIN-like protein [Alphaproteobacteria bacterium]
MRLLLDMNLPPAMATWLRGEGHDAVHARDLQLAKLPDVEVFARATADRRVVITFDLDFADLAAAAAGTGPGVVLLRLRSARQTHLRDRLRFALASTEALNAGGRRPCRGHADSSAGRES